MQGTQSSQNSLHDFRFGNTVFLDLIPKAQATREKLDKSGFHQN